MTGVQTCALPIYSTGGMPQVITWDSQFGDLDRVCMGTEPYLFQMKLVADAGYLVSLQSFDMACWPGVNYTINSVKIFEENTNTNTPLFVQTNVLILGSPSTPPQHSHFIFTNLTASRILIQYDATNVDSDDVGIDNITFSQVGTLLGITTSGSNVLLFWPTNVAGFTLQSTTNLVPPTVWTTVSPAPVVVNGQNAVTNAISSTRQFYRLSQ